MARSTPWKDEYTLLCEKCGYVVEGLDTAGPCPECGKPIEESLPGLHKGTIFQQNPSFKSTIKTAWMTIHKPNLVVEQMSYAPPHSTPLSCYLTYSIILCSIFLVAPSLIHLLFANSPQPADQLGPHWSLAILMTLGGLVILGLIIWVCFVVITCIFTAVITIAMKLFRTRGDLNVGWVIAGHASIGWAFTGLIWVCGFNFNLLISYLVPANTDWEKRVQVGILVKSVIEPTFLLGLLIGTLIFTYFAYLGIKQSRYLNLPRPEDSTIG